MPRRYLVSGLSCVVGVRPRGAVGLPQDDARGEQVRELGIAMELPRLPGGRAHEDAGVRRAGGVGIRPERERLHPLRPLHERLHVRALGFQHPERDGEVVVAAHDVGRAHAHDCSEPDAADATVQEFPLAGGPRQGEDRGGGAVAELRAVWAGHQLPLRLWMIGWVP